MPNPAESVGVKSWIVATVLFASCREHATTSAEVSCEQYLRHADELRHFDHPGPFNDAELAYCRQHTQDQLQCSLALTSDNDMWQCEQFTDPERRELGRTVASSIVRLWPGTAGLHDVLLESSVGCAFAGLMGQSKFTLDDRHAAAVFTIREPGASGDPADTIAFLVRENDDWTCSKTDPDGRCDHLAASCRRPINE